MGAAIGTDDAYNALIVEKASLLVDEAEISIDHFVDCGVRKAFNILVCFLLIAWNFYLIERNIPVDGWLWRLRNVGQFGIGIAAKQRPFTRLRRFRFRDQDDLAF